MKINRQYNSDYFPSSTANISAESISSIESYQQRRTKMNICLHKFFLGITVLINIGLIIFIAFYKKKIKELNALSSKYSNEINSNDYSLSEKRFSIDKKVVNIGASSYRGGFLFSYVFKNIDEVNRVKNMIKKFYEDKGSTKELKDFFPALIYQSFTHGTSYNTFFDELIYQQKIVFVIETQNNEKFGFFIGDEIIANINKDEENVDVDEDEDDSKNKEYKDVFIFSLNKENEDKIFKCKGNNCVKFKKDKIISLGEDDLDINNEFYDNGGSIEFPFKGFDSSIVERNPLTTKNGKFEVKYLEAFRFFE